MITLVRRWVHHLVRHWVPCLVHRIIMVVVVGIIIDVVFGIVIVVVVVVNCEDSTLSGQPAVGIIIVGDEAKGPIIVGIRVLDTVVGTIIV